ncbi:Serine/threonine-protein kinase PrkC [Aquisphaera giovannonii]|uniref:non-specific serine/threonine protein kinase n=1 Tax=Aquisphaera giovannonii TaxID=406548 RepID=A0A5B9WB35_9BACT|nr:serine/threonine-protein kinase [Aquisphaera giovannonii]QEH37796.1 Serine/threonine-protein kinase PrkC [Aquisphaera giovannonii]
MANFGPGTAGRGGDAAIAADRGRTTSPPEASASAGRGDPRVAAALEEYLGALEAGVPPSRESFLGRHADIAQALEDCLPGLEFVRAAGLRFEGASSREDREDPARAMTKVAGEAGMGRLGDYRILRELGRGSMGVVYEAEQVSLGRLVALKVLPFAAAIDPRRKQRFQIEAQAAAQLRHPHIVPVFAAGSDRGIHFYAMQLVEGRTLAQVIRAARGPGGGDPAATEEPSPADASTREVRPAAQARPEDGPPDPAPPASPEGSGRRSLDPRTVARLGIEAALALEHAHSLGVVHRDIKPANLMVDQSGSLWVTDFGLAQFRGDASLTRTGDVVGTLRYMSPEQALARRGVVDQRTDVYALGLTLYEMLTLRPAFDGDSHHELLRQIAVDEPAPPRKIEPSVPRDLETIVLKAASKEPAGRYATAQEMADDLRRFLDDRPIRARRPTRPERCLRWARRHRQVVLTAVGVLLVAAAVGVAAVAVQARKTHAVELTLLAHIRRSFPAVDLITMSAMQEATQSSNEHAGAADPGHLQEVYDKALAVYQEVADLPPIDPEFRKIIARAVHRMGLTRAFMSVARGSESGPDRRYWPVAEENFRDAVARFERILSEKPGDFEARRWTADALGGWGLGWFLAMTGRVEEAIPHNRRAFSIRRELTLESRGDSPVAAEELASLVWLTEHFSGLYASLGRKAELEDIRAELLSIGRELAQREWTPGQRRELATPLAAYGARLGAPDSRRFAVDLLLLAVRIDPSSPEANNNLAWRLASDPDVSPHDARLALSAARKAVGLNPSSWANWNTLGAAAYRAGEWQAASEAIDRSMELNKGGTPLDWAFMAMTRSRQGRPDEAADWLRRARQAASPDEEARRFLAEAESVLGHAPMGRPGTVEAGRK